MTDPQMDEDSTRRAAAIVTCLVHGDQATARQLVREDEDLPATAQALAMMLTGLMHSLARRAGIPTPDYWSMFAMHQEVAMAWWRDNGPTE